MDAPKKPNLPQPRPPENKNLPNNQGRQNQNTQQVDSSEQAIIGQLRVIDNLKDYPIRDLVTHSEKFGGFLKKQKLKTNQVRKFLDAVNRIKSHLNTGENTIDPFEKIKTEIILLKPKLAYASARQEAVKPLNRVMSSAIDKVKSLEDFERLVQLIESIIAYHKAAGGE